MIFYLLHLILFKAFIKKKKKKSPLNLLFLQPPGKAQLYHISIFDTHTEDFTSSKKILWK